MKKYWPYYTIPFFCFFFAFAGYYYGTHYGYSKAERKVASITGEEYLGAVGVAGTHSDITRFYDGGRVCYVAAWASTGRGISCLPVTK